LSFVPKRQDFSLSFLQVSFTSLHPWFAVWFLGLFWVSLRVSFLGHGYVKVSRPRCVAVVSCNLGRPWCTRATMGCVAHPCLVWEKLDLVVVRVQGAPRPSDVAAPRINRRPGRNAATIVPIGHLTSSFENRRTRYPANHESAHYFTVFFQCWFVWLLFHLNTVIRPVIPLVLPTPSP
jgi:hypothetical protein